MFGLMKRAPRMPYCGTCKTMGAIYGQRTRLLLNHDTVFLAELLMEISGQPHWSAAYRKRNCFAMPQGELPLALQFAAAATVTLAHFRIADHCEDSKSRMWRLAGRALAPSFRRASSELVRWGFPLAELTKVLASQRAREAQPESLEDVAEPTARATAMFFAHGSRLLGRPDLVEKMRRIGHRFGFLIYTLDAHEDVEKDSRNGDFNPLLALAGIDAQREILDASREISLELPHGLGVRLRANVDERLGLGQRVPAPLWRHAFAFAGIGVPPPPPPAGGPRPPKAESDCCVSECCVESCCEGLCESCDC